jgi:hypothetical protein
MLLDVGENQVRFDRGRRKSLQMGIAAGNLDSPEDLLCRFLPELGERRELSVLGDSLEILDGLDAQGVVNDLDFGDTQARYPHQIEKTLRHSFLEAREVR